MTRPADMPDGARGGVPEAATDGAPGHARASAPWVRTRLRSAPSSALLAAALAFVAVLLAAALPRALDRGADQALRSFLDDRGPAATSLLATSTSRYGNESPENLDSVRDALLARTGDAFAVAPAGTVQGTQAAKPRSLANPELPRPDGVPPGLDLLYLRDAAAHTALVEGRWPSGGAPDGPVPVAISQQAAQTLGVRIGTVLQTVPSSSDPMSAEVVGLYRATDEADVFWTGLPCLTRACASNTSTVPPQRYWKTAALVGPDGLDRLGPWGAGAEDFWRIPVDTDRLRADRLPVVAREIAAYVGGPTASALRGTTQRSDLRIASQLPELFKQAEARQQAVAPLAAIGPAGVAGVAAVVLCLAAALTGDRRESELRLLLARGGSPGGIVGRLLGEGAVTVLPAAALATALALWLLPAPRSAAALLAAGAVALLAWLAFPVRAAVLLSARRRGPAPRRRLVAELLVAAATAAAVFEVRQRGVAPAGEGLDPLLVAAPLLLALCGGLALARLQPVLVGMLARAAGRSSALVGFLGLARAARGTGGRARPPVLPLIALLLAVTTGGFGATVLDAVDSGRLRVARLAVGGDVQIAAPYGGALPPAMTEAAAALPGVRTSAGVWTDDKAFVFGTVQGSTQVTVVVAEPKAYAELARTIGRGQFDPALLSAGPSADAPVPALFSSDLAKLAVAGTYRLSLGGGELQIGSVGVVEGTPARPGPGGAVVVLPAGPTTARLPRTGRPDRWLATGQVDGDRLREAVRAAAPAGTAGQYTVRTSAGTAAELGSDPLQRSAVRLFWASVAAVAGFALLAVLLTLVRAAPERAALLARLRTMGLRPRDGIRLILTEALPQALAATVGGALVAVSAVALLGPAMDLSALVGSNVPTGLRLTAPPVLTQALGLALLVTLAVLAEAAISGRRQITTELRAGDQR